MATSKNFRQLTIMDELMSSPGDSPANHIQAQGNGLERRMNAICGPKCCALFKNAPRATLWAKTFSDLLVGTGEWFSTRCVLTWKIVGTPSNRMFFQLAPSMPPTDETEFGLLPTPVAVTRDPTKEETEARKEMYGGKTRAMYLDHWAAMEMLPTPTTHQQNTQFKQGGTCLQAHLVKTGLLPTPTTQEPENPVELNDKGRRKTGGTEEPRSLNIGRMASMGMLPTPMAQEGDKITGKENQDSLTKRARIGNRSQLNPRFVAEMMGFPPTWTESPFQNGGAKASKDMETPSFPK